MPESSGIYLKDLYPDIGMSAGWYSHAQVSY